MKRISYGCFILFSFFYLTTASSLALPYSSILRWVGSFLLFGCAILAFKQKRGRKKITLPKAYVFLALALVPTLMGIAGDSTIYSYGRIISLFLVVFGIRFFLAMDIMDKEDHKNFFEIYTFICGCMMVASAFFGENVMGRLAGVYANANQLSSIGMFGIISSLCVFFIRKGCKRRWLYLFFAGCAAYCVLATGSRMGAVCTGLAFFVIPVIISKGKTVNDYLKLILLLLFIGAVALFVLDRFEIVGLQRLFSISDSNVESSLGLTRGDTWGDVYKIFSEKPLFGWGYAQVSYKIFAVADTTYNWGVHSSYFVILLEMGIFGSLLFAAFFVSYFLFIRGQYKAAKPGYEEALFIKFQLLICVVMLINAYSESFLFSLGNPMSPCFWLPFILLSCFFKDRFRTSWKEMNYDRISEMQKGD